MPGAYERPAPSTGAPGAVDANGRRVPSLVYNFRTRTWGSLDADEHRPIWKPPPPITKHALDAVAVKGRGSHERDAWESCPGLLLSPQIWRVTLGVEFNQVEHMVVVLVRFLEHFTEMGNTPYEWCVGGSIRATYLRRDVNGESDEIHMVLCNRSEWSGNGSQKVGNTCKSCCEGITIDRVTLRGRVHERLKLVKCTWIKCCYGRRPFASPPTLHFDPNCQQQKQLEQKLNGGVLDGRQSGVSSRARLPARGVPQHMPTHATAVGSHAAHYQRQPPMQQQPMAKRQMVAHPMHTQAPPAAWSAEGGGAPPQQPGQYHPARQSPTLPMHAHAQYRQAPNPMPRQAPPMYQVARPTPKAVPSQPAANSLASRAAPQPPLPRANDNYHASAVEAQRHQELVALQNERYEDEATVQKRSVSRGEAARVAACDAFGLWAIAACKAGDADSLRCVRGTGFAKDAMLNARAARKRTLAHVACDIIAPRAAEKGRAECLRVLHDAGAGALLSSTDAEGRTPAHVAAACGNGLALRTLSELVGDAALLKPDPSGMLPSHLAASQGHTSCLQVLHKLAAGSLEKEDNTGCTPLKAAAASNHTATVGALEALLAAEQVSV